MEAILIGLIGGLAATGAMTLVEFPFWKRWGLQGVLEWHENQVLTSRFFNLDEKRLHFSGIFGLHFFERHFRRARSGRGALPNSSAQ